MLKPLSLVGVALLYSGQAQAACRIDNQFQHPITFANEIPVKQSTPIGEVVASTSNGNNNLLLLTCGASPTPVLFQGRYITAVSEIPGVYRTMVSGVGIRLKYQGEELDGAEQEFPYDVSRTFTATTPFRNRAGDLTVELVRIAGDVAAGSFPVGDIGRVNADGLRYRTIQVASIAIRVPTCSISTGSLNQTVELGRWRTSDFSAPGDGSDWREIRFRSDDCELAEFDRVDMEFNAAADTSNPDLFRVNGGATGVGIELRTEADVLVSPGTTASLAPVAAGNDYLFKARYTRTAAALAAGQANAAVTVTVSYH